MYSLRGTLLPIQSLKLKNKFVINDVLLKKKFVGRSLFRIGIGSENNKTY